MLSYFGQMKLMEGNIPALLDLIWSWIAPSEEDESIFRYFQSLLFPALLRNSYPLLVWNLYLFNGAFFNLLRPHGDPQMIRFGAHLVLVLRRLLADKVEDLFKEKIMTVGDLILHMY